MTFQPDTLAGQISTEILRVSAKRERDLRTAQAAGAVGEARQGLYLMDQALHFAREARDEMCPVAMIAWLRTLEDFR